MNNPSMTSYFNSPNLSMGYTMKALVPGVYAKAAHCAIMHFAEVSPVSITGLRDWATQAHNHNQNKSTTVHTHQVFFNQVVPTMKLHSTLIVTTLS